MTGLVGDRRAVRAAVALRAVVARARAAAIWTLVAIWRIILDLFLTAGWLVFREINVIFLKIGRGNCATRFRAWIYIIYPLIPSISLWSDFSQVFPKNKWNSHDFWNYLSNEIHQILDDLRRQKCLVIFGQNLEILTIV